MRDIAIFSDIQSNISTGEKDIITELFISAIYEGKTPILASKSVWNDFINTRKNFYEKSQQEDSPEQKYNNIFEKINRYFSDNAEKTQWSEKKLKTKLDEDKRLVYSNEAKKISESIKKIKNSITNNIKQNFTYFAAPLDNQSWDAYVSPTFILLIPKQYTKNLKNQLQNQINNLLTFGKNRGFNEEEIILGLKTQKLTKMGFSNKYELPIMETTETLDAETIKSDLHKIFITKQDLNLSKSSDLTMSFLLPYKWNIFIVGHGNYKKEPELETIQQKLKALYEKIGVIHSDLTKEKLKEMSEKDPNLLKKDQNGLSKIDIMNEIINNEEKIKKITTREIGMIAGMRIQQFKALLAFCQNNLNMSFLHYMSCFATGEKTSLIYTTHGITDIYNFPISASVTTDIITKAKKIEYSIFNIFVSSVDFSELLIEKDKNRITIQPKRFLQLNKFYQALKDKNTSYEELIGYVNFAKLNLNIPAIRFPGTPWLSVAKLDNIMDLSRIRTSIAAAKGSITLYVKEFWETKKTDYIILHTPYMPFKINVKIKKVLDLSDWFFNGLTAISLLSSQVGQPTHYIKSIDAPNVYLSNIVLSFIKHTRLSPKLFLIENLRCIDDKSKKTTNFKNVLIMNNSNVFDKNKIYNGYIFQHPDKQTATKLTREITRKPDEKPEYLPEKEENIDSKELTQKFEFYKNQLKQQSSIIDTKAIEEAIRKKAEEAKRKK